MFKLEGLIVPVITPRFNSKIDRQSLEKLINFLINDGTDIIFILGTTGEFQYQSIEEKQEVIEETTNIIKKRVPIIAGISANSLDETLWLMEIAKNQNIDGLVYTPLYNSKSPLGNLSIIIERSSLPIVLYNNPNIHRNENLPIDTIKKLAQIKGIAGIKDSSGDWEYFRQILRLANEKFKILQGAEKFILESLNGGASGIICGTGNVNPRLFKSLYLERNQDLMNQVFKLQGEIKKLSTDYIFGIKQKLVQLGIIKSVEMFINHQ